MKEMLTWRQVLAQQWYLTKFCYKKAPGVMAFHLFESIKLQVSIFFEFTWAVNYVLTVAEEGGDFRKILVVYGNPDDGNCDFHGDLCDIQALCIPAGEADIVSGIADGNL